MNQILDILTSLGFNAHVALANFVNFLILFFILKKFVFGKLDNVIRERTNTIERGIENEKKTSAELSLAKEKKLQILKEAEQKAGEILDTAIAKGEEAAKALLEAERGALKDREVVLLRKENALEEEALRHLEKKAPEVLAMLFEKALKDSFTKEDNERLIASVAK